MRRRLAAILLCLLVGLLTTVGSALHRAEHARFGRGVRRLVPTSGPPLHAWIDELFGASRVRLDMPTISSPPRDDLGSIPAWARPHRTVVIEGADAPRPWPRTEDAFGIPFRALGCTWLMHGTPAPGGRVTYYEPAVHDGLRRIGRPGELRALPQRLIVPGLLADVAVHGGVAWLVLFGPLAWRRLLRRRRGRCVACGYDLRGVSHETCPECGHGIGAGTAHERAPIA